MSAQPRTGWMERAAWALLCVFVFSIPWEKSVWVPQVGSIARLLGILAFAGGAAAAIRYRSVRMPNLALALAAQVGLRGRHRLAAGIQEHLAEFTRCHFGPPGPAPGLRAIDLETLAIVNTGHAEGSLAVIGRLLQKADEALQRGDAGLAEHQFMEAVAFANWFGGPEDRDVLRAQAPPFLRAMQSRPDHGPTAWGHKVLFEAAVADGRFQEAEGLLPGFHDFLRDHPWCTPSGRRRWASSLCVEGTTTRRKGTSKMAWRPPNDGGSRSTNASSRPCS